MSVSIRFSDELQKKLNEIRDALDRNQKLKLNLSYYKILKLLIDEAHKQLVMEDEDKNKVRKTKKKN